MLRKVSLKQGLYIFGAAAVAYYSYWLVNEINDVQNQNIAAFPAKGLLIDPAQINEFTSDEDKRYTQLQNKIRFDYTVAENATDLDWQIAHADKAFILEIAMKAARENPMDACKLDTLLNFSPKFFIRIAKDLNRTAASAIYQDGPNLITFPIGVQHKFPGRTQDAITHELKHAIDTHNNLQAGLCLWDRGGVMRTKFFIHSKGKTHDDCVNDMDGLAHLNSIINSDIERLEAIYRIINKRAAMRTAKENSLIEVLDALIKEYNYQQRMLNMVDANPELKKYIKKYYKYDEESQSYKYEDKTVLALDWEYKRGKTSIRFSRYLIEYNPSTDESLFAFTDLTDHSPENLRIDLIRGLLVEMGIVFSVYSGFVLPAEVATHLEEIVAPHSHLVTVGERTLNLKTFLFPKLDAYEKMRYAAEFAQCLEQRVYRAR